MESIRPTKPLHHATCRVRKIRHRSLESIHEVCCLNGLGMKAGEKSGGVRKDGPRIAIESRDIEVTSWVVNDRNTFSYASFFHFPEGTRIIPAQDDRIECQFWWLVMVTPRRAEVVTQSSNSILSIPSPLQAQATTATSMSPSCLDGLHKLAQIWGTAAAQLVSGWLPRMGGLCLNLAPKEKAAPLVRGKHSIYF